MVVIFLSPVVSVNLFRLLNVCHVRSRSSDNTEVNGTIFALELAKDRLIIMKVYAK